MSSHHVIFLAGFGALACLMQSCQADPETVRNVAPETAEPTGKPPAGLSLPEPTDAFGADGSSEEVSRPESALPESLRADTWLKHLRDDILPFWTSSDALGQPVGNFPTFRGMDGSVQQPGERRPRMLSRQIYTLAVGFAMTGDVTLLDSAFKGVRWLADHALDTTYGGFHALLDASGAPIGGGPKTAQDTAYVALGPAMVAWLTGDPLALSLVEAARQVLFDPTGFFDASSGMIRDAMAPDMSAPVDLFDDGGTELVAQLDVVTALLLHAERLVPEPQRAEVRDQLGTLGHALLGFIADDMVWGVDIAVGTFGGRHSDFGHAAKCVWALHLIDARVSSPLLGQTARDLRPQILTRAFDAPNGRWAKRPLSATSVEYGSDWWITITLNQLEASTATNHDRLAQVAAHFLTDYVDRGRPVRGLVPSVGRDGAWVWPWSDEDTAKCNAWKNGYHAAEHALVMYLTAHARQGSSATLHFARDKARSSPPSTPTPYLFDGTPRAERVVGDVVLSGRNLQHIAVDFSLRWDTR